jgi:hypothetical protein
MTRSPIRVALLAAVLSLASVPPASALVVKFLQAEIDPSTVGWLSGLSCRNYDHIVHLDLSISWPSSDLEVEKSDYERLVFWNKTAEYLFPKGSYSFLHGSYVVKGYFIARSGGMHQGAVSNAFDKIDDAQVMLSPNVTERKTRRTACR